VTSHLEGKKRKKKMRWEQGGAPGSKNRLVNELAELGANLLTSQGKGKKGRSEAPVPQDWGIGERHAQKTSTVSNKTTSKERSAQGSFLPPRVD